MPGATENPSSLRAVILASFVGTTIEWYDFFLYGTASALVFGRIFFPDSDPLSGTLSAFGTFAVGFAARPIGGLVFGHYGDRIGRKAMLVHSLLIMGIATFAIGLLPTYRSAGPVAPALLVVLRFFQGIGVGGEWGGAVLMAVEHSGARGRGLAGSWPQMGVPAGLLLSTGVFALLSAALSEAEFLAWGWRLPFLASALLVVVGMFIRLRILESPAFVRLKAESRTHARPIVELVRTHRRSILLAAGMRVAENGTFYVFTVFVLSYGEHELRLPRALLLDGVLMAAAAGLAAIPLYGALSDRIGRRRVIMAGALFTLLFAFPFFRLLETRRPLFVQLAIMLAVNLGHDPMYGPQAAFFSELFGAGVRYSGASLSYQLTSVVTGGLAPFIATLLLARAGTSAVAAYMAVMSAITLASAWLAEETCGRDLPDSEEVEPPPLSRIGS